MRFELTNEQRRYFGLDPIEPHWEYVEFRGDQYREPSVLVYDGEIIKRHIISNSEEYSEYQYNEKTKDRAVLLPKTAKGKEQKLSPSTFEKRKNNGVYFSYMKPNLIIGNSTTETKFYDNQMAGIHIQSIEDVQQWVEDYLAEATEKDLQLIDEFKSAKRKRVKYKTGDVFSFKLDNKHYGFGKIIAQLKELIEEHNLSRENHFLANVMQVPLVVRLYCHCSADPSIDLADLEGKKFLPSQMMSDNNVFYGEYQIIGNQAVKTSELDFQINFSDKSFFRDPDTIVLQWGVIQKELPRASLDKHLKCINERVDPKSYSYNMNNPFQNIAIGFDLQIDKNTLLECIRAKSVDPYWKQDSFRLEWDLRNPIHSSKRKEIMKTFGLNPDQNYHTNFSEPIEEEQVPRKKFSWRKLFGK